MHQALLLGVISPGASVAAPFEYSWHQGSLSLDNGDVQHGDFTITEAQAECTALPHCRGFTYHGTNISRTKQRTFFVTPAGARVNANSTWSAWFKTGVVTPPAITTAVGQSNLTLSLRAGSFTVQALNASADPWLKNYSFTRMLDGGSALPSGVHLGDVTLRIQNATSTPHAAETCERNSSGWLMFSTAAGIGGEAIPVQNAVGDGQQRALAAHDISPVLSFSAPGHTFPLKVIRSYEVSADGRALVIRFNLSLASKATSSIRIGGLGFPMPEGSGRPPAGIEGSVWCDAHIGGDHGFVEYVRVVDDEATLLVLAEKGHSQATKMEGWRPIMEDETTGGVNYEWVVYSAAWAAEWACNQQSPIMEMPARYSSFYPNATTPWPCADGDQSMPRLPTAQFPWNEPTSKVLHPGDEISLALRLQRAPSRPGAGAGAESNKSSSRAPAATPLPTTTGPGPRTRNALLESIGEPVLVGVPGYVLSSDMRSAQLLVLPPAGATISRVDTASVGAGGGAIAAGKMRVLRGGRGYVSIPLSVVRSTTTSTTTSTDSTDTTGNASGGEARGRVRLTVHFSDSTTSIVHYYVLPPFPTQVSRLGAHLAYTAWLPRDYPDPFGRSASFMPWDRSADGGKGAHVLNDARAYDVGLSDDAGGGNPLCIASKVHAMPTQGEVGRIDDYIKWTLYGIKTDTAKPPFKSLQVGGDPSTGCQGATPPRGVDCDGVRMTLYYYGTECDIHTFPKRGLPNATWSGHWPWNYTEARKCSGLSPVHPWCMDERVSNATYRYRAFNYPHQTAVYWAMYHVARHYSKLSTYQPWQWYLERAALTSLRFSCGTGVMDGTVFREVLEALKGEGRLNATFAGWAEKLDSRMEARQKSWQRKRFPYGSEFAFDTTGQEEVVVWNMYYGNNTAAKATVDHILSYMRSIPSWAYNGGARAADSGNGGKYLCGGGNTGGRPDRGQMHYRSGLNMIPLIEWYRANPDDLFLLEVAMGAIGGQLTNIDATGAASMMWHAYPWVMDFDPHSGDYGLGFFGNALESGAYFVQHPRLGPLCFLCTATAGTTGSNRRVSITPEDAYRRRVFIEPLALYLRAQAGTIARVIVQLQPSPLVTIVFNATEWGERPWSKLRLILQKTSDSRFPSLAGNFSVMVGGKHVANLPTSNSTYAFDPQSNGETDVVVSCL